MSKKLGLFLVIWIVLAAFTPFVREVERGFSPGEERSLAALCWVECRGMQDQRSACCSSVIDTVMTRIERNKITDGTITGTIRFQCYANTLACQFPSYVTRGCQGINSPCPFNDEEGMELFSMVVQLYDHGAIKPTCSGYLYYGLKDFDKPECRVQASNGQWVNFHNGTSLK
jgi:hypothetical protein